MFADSGLRDAAEVDTKYYSDVNGVPLSEGRVTHLGLAAGELAQRVVCTGSLSRAERLRDLFDDPGECFTLTSPRGFTTFTGTFEGTALSVVATGMGAPMMDFFVREARAITSGPMVIIRFGSCGGLGPSAPPGTLAVCTGAVDVRRNADTFFEPNFEPNLNGAQFYHISNVTAKPDSELQSALSAQLRAALGAATVEGLNASCDSFYASQGRRDLNFDDRNEDLIKSLKLKWPRTISMEMETFHLLHLANYSTGNSIRAAAAAVVCANRDSTDIIDTSDLHRLETCGGRAILKALASAKL
ncbi:nucleoside phosphorylase domain-containing protein [Pelagophyceae sp. CCMP2097]|nr:nucleoside phosphorylase domain-containing protein [Pelagophyceae sp. CCMP2097]|mmetsp:Transcript_7359/g.23981  ORF Transcript_7359/g.23981 Transcript_7359/m.23981 type:complete len:301 (-) Transcript_7359:79-981(-)